MDDHHLAHPDKNAKIDECTREPCNREVHLTTTKVSNMNKIISENIDKNTNNVL